MQIYLGWTCLIALLAELVGHVRCDCFFSQIDRINLSQTMSDVRLLFQALNVKIELFLA